MTDKLASALAKAQAEMENAPLNKTNPHFRSKYADLAAIRDATMPALAKNGLAIVQFTKVCDDGSIRLVTRLMHQSGETIEGEYPLPMAADKPQVMGSAITYARRYCWAAMCGITADEDDDANEAQANAPKQAPKAAPKPPAGRQSPPAGDPFAGPPMATSFAVPETPGFLRLPTITNANRADVWRAFYKTFQTIIDTSESVTELSEWMGTNADNIKTLAAFNEQGADALRDRAKKRMHFLSQAPGEQVA